jgi:sulfur carrier protein
MINILLNGEPHQVIAPLKLTEFLDEKGYIGQHFAVAIDGEFIPRSQYDRVTLEGGESVEVLSPKQGG